MVTQKITNNNRHLRESHSENADKLGDKLEYPRNCVEFPKRKAVSIRRKSRENRGLAVFPARSILRGKRETAAACNLRRRLRRRRSVVLRGFHAAQPDHLVRVVLDEKEHAGLLAAFLHLAEAEDHQQQNQPQRGTRIATCFSASKEVPENSRARGTGAASRTRTGG